MPHSRCLTSGFLCLCFVFLKPFFGKPLVMRRACIARMELHAKKCTILPRLGHTGRGSARTCTFMKSDA